MREQEANILFVVLKIVSSITCFHFTLVTYVKLPDPGKEKNQIFAPWGESIKSKPTPSGMNALSKSPPPFPSLRDNIDRCMTKAWAACGSRNFFKRTDTFSDEKFLIILFTLDDFPSKMVSVPFSHEDELSQKFLCEMGDNFSALFV